MVAGSIPAEPTADVAVVGGGIVGATLALELVRGGASVVLLDRADAGRATAAGAGILSPDLTWGDDDAWYQLCLGGGRYHEGLARELDIGWARCGVLKFASRESDLPAFDWLAERVTSRGGDVQLIDGDAAVARFPLLSPPLKAMWHPGGARVDGRQFTAAVTAEARARGVDVRDADVAAIETDGGAATAVVLRGGATIPARAVVICGGAWTPPLAGALGVDLPVRPLRGQILHLGLDVDTSEWPIAQPVLGHYLVPWPGGRVAAGATVEDAGFEPRPTAGGVAEVVREAVRIAPRLAEATLLEVRAGLRPASADGRPFLGLLTGWRNVFVATGHGADGLLLGPYSGKLVADVVLGREADLDLTTFSPARPVKA